MQTHCGETALAHRMGEGGERRACGPVAPGGTRGALATTHGPDRTQAEHGHAHADAEHTRITLVVCVSCCNFNTT